MLADTPSHTIQILRRKDSPNEQVRSQHGTRRHNEKKAYRDKYGHHCHVLAVNVLVALLLEAQKHDVGGRSPEDWTDPVTDKCEDAHRYYVVAAHTVIGIREINRRDGIGASESKEGRILEKEGGCGHLNQAEVKALQKPELALEKKEEWDVGCPRLGDE